jgi:hypothetical protein
MRANYNARPCDGERKAAVPRTMASNGKNNAQSNGNSRKSGRVLTSGCDRGKTGNDAAREPLSDGPGLLAGLRVSLGAQFPD